jgi:hypothetical protein
VQQVSRFVDGVFSLALAPLADCGLDAVPLAVQFAMAGAVNPPNPKWPRRATLLSTAANAKALRAHEVTALVAEHGVVADPAAVPAALLERLLTCPDHGHLDRASVQVPLLRAVLSGPARVLAGGATAHTAACMNLEAAIAAEPLASFEEAHRRAASTETAKDGGEEGTLVRRMLEAKRRMEGVAPVVLDAALCGHRLLAAKK